MKKNKANIFSNFSSTTYSNIRKFMISNILATDIKEHFNLLHSLEVGTKKLQDKQATPQFGKKNKISY